MNQTHPLRERTVAPRSSSVNREEALRRSSSKSVLVVDDNRDSADSLGMLLRALGYDVRIAYDGVQALESARTASPDFVLLDLGMPGMSGCEVARRLRAMPEMDGVQLMALTGWSGEEDRGRSQDAGFDHHLVKPVEVQKLKALLAGVPTA